MKKTFYIFSTIILFLSTNILAQEYHFQEGFESNKPAGWIRTCGATTTLNHTGLSFSGASAIKFDKTCIDETLCLETPEYANAGTLSFYTAKNTTTIEMDLFVCQIVDGVSTLIKTIKSESDIAKDWGLVTIDVNVNKTVKFKIYSAVRNAPSGFIVIDDMELTKYGNTEPVDPEAAIDKVSTNLGDALWGIPLTSVPNPFPTDTINGFILTKAYLNAYAGKVSNCLGGEIHTNRIQVDKASNGGSIELPLLKTVGQIEIHAITGTAGSSFRLEEKLSNGTWSTIDTYTTKTSPDSVYIITLERNASTRLRIANNTGSGLYVFKIATTTYQEYMDVNVVATKPAKDGVCFYNLTKSVQLTLNREVELGTGIITLGSMQIPVSSCTVDGVNINIPVSLPRSTSEIVYTMNIPQGAFVEKANRANANNAYSFSFKVDNAPAYPANYSSQTDVVYSPIAHQMQRMDIYYPTTSEKAVPVLINMHGGGWTSGEKESQGGFDTYFNMGFAVANVEYRMRGDAPAPAAVEDVRAAMLYLVQHAAELNIDPSRIVFQGGSAGGHLALTGGYLQNTTIYNGAAFESNPTTPYKVIAVIDKYGPSHLVEFMHYSSLQAWLGDKKTDIPFVESISPAILVNESTPPTYIIHGDADPTVEYQQSLILIDSLISKGVKYQFTTVPGGGHGGFTTEWNTQMTTEVVAFLTNILDSPTSVESSTININTPIVIFNNGKLTVNTDGECNTEMFNSNGIKLFSTNKKQFDVPQFSNNLLIVKTTTASGTYVNKILK